MVRSHRYIYELTIVVGPLGDRQSRRCNGPGSTNRCREGKADNHRAEDGRGHSLHESELLVTFHCVPRHRLLPLEATASDGADP